MTKVTSILKHRKDKQENLELKALKKVIEDQTKILEVIGWIIRALEVFKHYTRVMEILSMVLTNKQLVEIEITKLKQRVEALENDSLEKAQTQDTE